MLPFIISCKDNSYKNSNKRNDKIQNTKKTDTLKIKVKKITLLEIPSTIKVGKDFITARKWKDIDGDNILVIYRSIIKKSAKSIESQDEYDVDFFVSKYTKKNNKYKKVWSIYDYIKNCSFDMYIGLANENSIYITDLDKDGQTEVSVAYYLTCRSDISPSNYKFIMRESDKKYALRGTTILNIYKEKIDLNNFEPDLSKIKAIKNNKDIDLLSYGRFKSENEFKKNTIFLKFAKKKWKENMFETEFKQLRLK